MQTTMSFNDVAIFSIKGCDYRIHFWYTSKDDSISIMKKSDLKKVDHYNFFFIVYRMGETTYYKRNREIILNRAKD